MPKPFRCSWWPKSPRSWLARPSSFAFAVAVEPQHQAFAAARQPHQRVGERLLVELGEVFASMPVFDHHLDRRAHAGGLRELGLFARIDESRA